MLNLNKKLKAACLILLFSFSVINVSSKNVIIRGNIKFENVNAEYADACSFQYHDLLSDRTIIIPVSRDGYGNFELQIDLESYQQITLFQARYTRDKLSYYNGTSSFSFFVMPAKTVEITFLKKSNGTSVSFKGDLATENKQYEDYIKAQPDNENPYLMTAKTIADYPAFREKLIGDFNLMKKFNNDYFTKNHTAPFVQRQITYDLYYSNADVVTDMIFTDKITEQMGNELFRAINVPTKNLEAIGNDRYDSFLQSQYSLLNKNVNMNKQPPSFSTEKCILYILENHKDLSAADQALLKMTMDSTFKPTEKEIKRHSALMGRFVNDFIATLEHNLPEFDHAIGLADPFFRDLYSTISLYKLVNTRQIDYIKANLAVYDASVKNIAFKTRFKTAYNKQLYILKSSTLSPASVINDAADLAGTDFFNQIIQKYKGKVIYIDVWATWCNPCIAEMANSQMLRKKLEGKDVVFVYLCTNSTSTVTWKELIAVNKIEGENYFLSFDQSKIFSKDFNISTIPRYILIDQNGKVVDREATYPGEKATLTRIISLIN